MYPHVNIIKYFVRNTNIVPCYQRALHNSTVQLKCLSAGANEITTTRSYFVRGHLVNELVLCQSAISLRSETRGLDMKSTVLSGGYVVCKHTV